MPSRVELAERRTAYAQRASRTARPAAKPARVAARPSRAAVRAGRIARVVKYARAQIGKPYRFGASGPRGFDCSGLTMAAWRRAGVRLPHSSRGQARRGYRTRRPAPGALVVWNGHVGVFIGDGRVVHAPGRGRRIAIARIWGRPVFNNL